jgi:hypothetical protein
MGKFRYLLAPFMIAVLTGCSAQPSHTEQSKLCVFSGVTQAAKCKNGELAMFTPNSWGNDQLPLVAVAEFCNTNHQVIYNKSGVVCEFTNKRLPQAGKKK